MERDGEGGGRDEGGGMVVGVGGGGEVFGVVFFRV